jgi:hypothetical protein
MTDINLKTLTPDTSLPTTGFLFGADSQASTNPSVYSTQTVATTLLGSTSLTGDTLTASAPVLNLAQTWNNGAVTFTGMRFNAAGTSDANSAAASLLMDLQTGGTSLVNVGKNGSTTFACNGAASVSAVKLTGTYFSGGTSTTTKPLFLIETTGATSNAWNTGGTLLGVNASSAFASGYGDYLNLSNNGARVFAVQIDGAGRSKLISSNSGFNINSRNNTFSFTKSNEIPVHYFNDVVYTLANTGTVSWSSTFDPTATPDTFITRKNTRILQLGQADAASPLAQTLSVQSVVASSGTNTAGQDFTITGSQGTGSGVGGSIIFQTAAANSGGGAGIQNTLANAMTIDSVKTVRLGTGYTVATLPAAGTAGRRTYVTNALAPTFLGTLTGGGSVVCPVFDNGTAWVSA